VNNEKILIVNENRHTLFFKMRLYIVFLSKSKIAKNPMLAL